MKFFQNLLDADTEHATMPDEMYCLCNKLKLEKIEKHPNQKIQTMCDLIFSLQSRLNFSSTGIGLFIAIVNFIFRTLLIWSADQLQPSTFTDELIHMKRIIFIVAFLNSGILIILMSANFDKPILRQIFTGQYNDFTSEWYTDVGQIIKINLMTNAAYPFIEMVMLTTMQRYSMMRDQDSWNPCKIEEFPKKTKCSQVTQYYNLYVGP